MSDRAARVMAFDLARGIAVLLMILIHVERHWGQVEVWTSPAGVVIATLVGPLGAPVFMVVMGAALAYSRRTDARSLAIRGLGLIAAGYVLNVLRGPLPLALGQAVGLIGPDGIPPYTPWSLLTMVDILQFAGLSFILIAGLRRVLPARPLPWVAAALVALLIGQVVRGHATGLPLADAALGLLWATGSNVFYPLLPWAVFPLVGVAVGRAVKDAADPARALRRLALVGAVLTVLGGLLLLHEAPVLDAPVYWALPAYLVPSMLGVMLVWFWVCDLVGRRSARAVPTRLFVWWSQRVTSVYVAHWPIVAYGIGLVGYLVLDLRGILLGAAAVAALAHLSALGWQRLRARPEAVGVDHSPVIAGPEPAVVPVRP